MNNAYTEEQLIDGSISREYSDRTTFMYHKWDTRNLFVEAINFLNRDIAFGDLQDFTLQKKHKNIYVFVKPEMLKSVGSLLERLGYEHIAGCEINKTHVNFVYHAKK